MRGEGRWERGEKERGGCGEYVIEREGVPGEHLKGGRRRKKMEMEGRKGGKKQKSTVRKEGKNDQSLDERK